MCRQQCTNIIFQPYNSHIIAIVDDKCWSIVATNTGELFVVWYNVRKREVPLRTDVLF